MELLVSVGDFCLCDLLVLVSNKDQKMAIINTADKRDSHKIFEKFKGLIPHSHSAWTPMSDNIKAVKASLSNTNNKKLFDDMQKVVDEYAPIGQYIHEVREIVLKKRGDKAKRPSYLFIIGNESCDLDSAISAIALAFYLSKMPHGDLKQHVQHVDENVIVVPILQIENGDMVLKSESLFYMRANRLDLETVLTM